MSLRRPIASRSAIAHANAVSITHAKDAAAQQQRRAKQWEIVEPQWDYASAKATFGLDFVKLGLPAGECFVPKGRSGTLCAVEGPAFERHLRRTLRRLSWNWEVKKNKDAPDTRRKRSRKKPLSEVVVNLSPAQNLYLSKLGDAARVREKVLSLVQPVADEFKAATGRRLYGVTVHFDSAKAHINLYESRVTLRHHLVGTKGLHTLGPWSVGQQRLAGLGVVSEKAMDILNDNLKRFRTRHGERSEPIDLRLHRILDEQFTASLSSSQTDCLRDCEQEHIRWKQRQQHQLGVRQADAEQVAFAVLRLVTRFLPVRLQKAITIAGTLTAVVSAIRAEIDGSSPLAHREIKQPTHNI